MVYSSGNIVEFLLWDNCNNYCKFCFLKDRSSCKTLLNDNEKANSIFLVREYINSGKIKYGDDILLCGGELFDTDFDMETMYEWETLIDDIVLYIKMGRISSLYINTNLIYKINSALIFLLEKFKNIGFDKLHFTTSFDLIGRYKCSEDKELFLSNINYVNSTYPGLNIIANMILTKPVCNLILSGDIDIFELQREMGVVINPIPYIVLLDKWAPDKSMVMDVLRLIYKGCPEYFNDYSKRFMVDKKRTLLKYDGSSYIELTSDINNCGHSVNFSNYTTGNSCFLCDLECLERELNGRI